MSIKEIDGTALYLNGLHKTFLTPEEEKELLIAYKKGDKKAFNKLVEMNLRLVASIAKEFTNRGADLDDLIQQGNIGLMNAIKKFDITTENRLSTYATPCIEDAIKKYLVRNVRTIKVPDYLYYELESYKHKLDELVKILGHEPTIKEISFMLDISKEKVIKYTKLLAEPISLNADNDECDFELIDVLPSEENVEDEVVTKLATLNIDDIVNDLPLNLREKEFLTLRFKENYTLQQLADKFNFKRQRAYQIEKAIFRKIIMSAKAKKYSEYRDDSERALKYVKEKRKEYNKKNMYA